MHKIAIIDTGVDLKNRTLVKRNRNAEGVYFFRKTEGNISLVTTKSDPMCIQDNVGHGTAMYNIILSHNENVEFFFIKLYNSEGDYVDENMFTFALEYVYSSTNCDIVSCSLGISVLQNHEKLYDICNKFRKTGRIITAAFDNAGGISFPAEYDSVIGVSSFDIGSRNDYILVENSPVNVLAYGRNQRIVWLDNSLLFGYGNSYACAHFSGILSGYPEQFEENKLAGWLSKNCNGTIKLPTQGILPSNPVLHYKKAVVFPFNKEIHSLIRFSDLLSFELVDIYETKYSALVSASTDSLLNEKCPKEYIIKNINNIQWDTFDTFILGHIDEYLSAINMAEYKQKLIYEILVHGKNLYSLDDIDAYIPENFDKSKAFYPAVKKADVPNNSLGKLYRYDIPVLGVFGTSSRQGKFTLQLKLRRKFLASGYRVVQVGTEPTALLYGMDVVFPVGYNSTVNISKHDVIRFLNYKIWKASRNADIALVGGQAGTIPRDNCNTDNYNFTALELLYAAVPDAVILLINSSDSIDLIERTIKFIEAATDGKVIAAVMLVRHQKKSQGDSGVELEQLTCESELSVPLYLLNDDQQMETLFESIISFFS